MDDIEEKRCIYCQGIIHISARICKHCGAKQHGQVLSILMGVLKIVGAGTVLVSLIIGAAQIKTLFKESQRKRDSVNTLVAAAKEQFKLRDRLLSKKLLKMALNRDPSSTEAQKLQITIMQNKLHSLDPSTGDNYIRQLSYRTDENNVFDWKWEADNNEEELIQFFKEIDADACFSSKIIHAEGEEKADLLAHYAWVKMVLSGGKKVDVQNLFDKALQADPGSFYANALYGAWLLRSAWWRDKKIEEIIPLARQHFEKALERDENIWVWVLWQHALFRIGLNGELERLRVANVMRKNGLPMGSAFSRRLLENNLSYWGGMYDAQYSGKEKDFEYILLERYPYAKLLDILGWLSGIIFHCQPGSDCDDKVYQDELIDELLYAWGRLHELNKDYSKALEAYRLAQISGKYNQYSNKCTLKGLQRVLSALNRKPIHVVKYEKEKRSTSMSHVQGLIHEKDIILTYNGQRVKTPADIARIEETIDDKVPFVVEIIRDGKSMQITYNKSLFYGYCLEYIIPSDLILGDGTDDKSAIKLQNWFKVKPE